MPSIDFGILGHWIVGQSYTLLFIAMLIEGPVVTAAGAFAAALGALDIWAVFILSILGNLIPDVAYYAVGFWGREKFVDKYGHYIGLTKEKIEKAEKAIHKHAGKSLIAIKLIPLLATPGLVAAGIAKMDIKKFSFWCIIITIPSSLVYLAIGYYFGAAYDRLVHYLNIGGYIIAAAIAIVLLALYFQRRFTEKFAKEFEE
jgi:membrane protein DedA with SNARE-associated domain